MLQLKQRMFGSYSARINNFLERKKLKNLISSYGTFEKWEDSGVSKILVKYLNFRLFISRKIRNFEGGNIDIKPIEKLVIVKVLIPFKHWKKRRKN
jgi:hypothetical protein